MPPRIYRHCLIVCSACLLVAAAAAQPQAPQPAPGAAPPAAQGNVAAPGAAQPQPPAQERRRDLDTVTARLTGELGKQFVVDPRLRAVDFGSIDPNAIDYPTLISLLRVHDAVVVESEDIVYVVHEANARFYATPLVQRDDADLHPATWVARVITTSNDATHLLGVLRPLATQSAVMGIHAPNKLLIVERYDNVKRITEIVRMLDQR